MNMYDVNCFIKVVELMSFSKAAEELYISQQAVSIHIKNLEETYHVKLFERKPALKLTEPGKILLSTAYKIIQQEERMVDQLNFIGNDYHGEISIGLPPNRSAAFASGFIPLFSKKYPDLTIRLMELSSTDLFAAVKQNKIDLALPLLPSTDSIPEAYLYVPIPLEVEKCHIVISNSLLAEYFPDQYPACKKKFQAGVSLQDFAGIPMFLRPSTSRLHREIVERLSQNGTPPFIRLNTSMTSAMIPLCAEGYGMLFCPPMILQYLYEEHPKPFKSLNVFPMNDEWGMRKSILIYHKLKYISQPLSDSIQLIQENYRQHQVWFSRKFCG